MLFNSDEFLGFFALFCAAYFVVRRHLVARNLLLVVASYVFYSAWDYRFAGLLLFTSVLDFSVAQLIEAAPSEPRRRGWLAFSLGINLAVLGLFKYFGFFRESLATLLNGLGVNAHWSVWQIILPVGLSFYTFQSMSYVIDVYRRQLKACRNPLQFLAYDSFFPQLVAGPIGRGRHLLPQFGRPLDITIADLEWGIWLVLWGLFKKVVLADNLAPLVDLVYRQPTTSGPMVLAATAAFGLQIYCDFSGYSDIARGLARLLGFELGLNFNLPAFACSLREFWRRWHISLSTWLRDYLYIPLGGERRGPARTYLNLGITMLLGGLWHGAALTFVLWGAWHGLGLMLNRWWEQPARRALPIWLAWLATQLFVLYGWLLFRADSLDQVLQLSGALTHLSVPIWWRPYVTNLLLLASPLAAMQLWQWRSGNLHPALNWPRWRRAALQGALVLLIVAYWKTDAASFIYFQF
jgi:alginate O-acetyltransferase complex protein AlgI